MKRNTRRGGRRAAGNVSAILGDLAAAFGRLAAALSSNPAAPPAARAAAPARKAAPAPKVKARRVTRPLSPARRKALQMQGRYMAAVRMLSAGSKDRVKQIRDRKGVEAALRFALRLGK